MRPSPTFNAALATLTTKSAGAPARREGAIAD
jgi:hypothetical protein